MEPIIKSILDSDLYKFSMQSAVLFGQGMGISYEGVGAKYRFINRGGTQFPTGFKEVLEEQIRQMANLALTDDEYLWMRRTCRFLKRSYLDYLRGYKFDPNEVQVTQRDGELIIDIRGGWVRTILWEVPLMAIISELYFRMTSKKPDAYWECRMVDKAEFFTEHKIPFADFGTRRRFSYNTQDALVRTMKEKCKYFIGTSNVHLAHKYDVKPIGTHAHEFFMAHGALFGFRLANRCALQSWVDQYQGNLGIALSDTFTTEVFFDDFDMLFAKLFDGIRHDSGSPYEFADKVIAHYKRLEIDPVSKTIVFSDGLTPQDAHQIQQYCRGKIRCSFGIGTNLSNDCGHIPLNMVIKLIEVRHKDKWIKTVKLSDVPGKETGDPKTIKICKKVMGLS